MFFDSSMPSGMPIDVAEECSVEYEQDYWRDERCKEHAFIFKEKLNIAFDES